MEEEIIIDSEDVALMLDSMLQPKEGDWWDGFYSDRSREIPFLTDLPDENLVSYLNRPDVSQGAALDIGCGNGRNSFYMARRGFSVTGLDFSAESIALAKKNNSHEKAEFLNASFFDFEPEERDYSFIYDGGCLHHIAPHRRPGYLKKVCGLLSDDGYYGMEIFNSKGGAELADYEVYRLGNMRGGLAYSGKKLEMVLSPWFEIVELREMKQTDGPDAWGRDFSWAVLCRKRKVL